MLAHFISNMSHQLYYCLFFYLIMLGIFSILFLYNYNCLILFALLKS